MPVILLAIAGNRLTVSSAIFTDSVYADELVSVKLCFPPHPSENVLRIARIFTAIDRCAGKLRKMYRDLARDSATTPLGQVLWPNPTPDPSYPAGDIPEPRFFSKLDCSRGTPIKGPGINDDDKQREIFLAKMKRAGNYGDGGASDDTVLVEFAPKYNERAHRILADQDPHLPQNCSRAHAF